MKEWAEEGAEKCVRLTRPWSFECLLPVARYEVSLITNARGALLGQYVGTTQNVVQGTGQS